MLACGTAMPLRHVFASFCRHKDTTFPRPSIVLTGINVSYVQKRVHLSVVLMRFARCVSPLTPLFCPFYAEFRLHGRCVRRFSYRLPFLCSRIVPLPPASVSSSSSCVALFLLLRRPLPPASSFCSLGGCRESPWGSFITRLGEFIYSPRRVSSLP